MNVFGIGGPELLVILAVGLFVLGPKRLMEGIREGKRFYTELKRQRDALTAMINEAIELDELKKQVNTEQLAEGFKEIEKELSLDQMVDVQTETTNKAVRYRTHQPPQPTDEKVRAIPDLGINKRDDDPGQGNESPNGEARA